MEEEPGMSRPKQRKKLTGDEEEAFSRHTQVSAKEGSCRRRPEEAERRPVEAEKRLAKVEMPKKMEKQGSERTDGGLEVQDGEGRACW